MALPAVDPAEAKGADGNATRHATDVERRRTLRVPLHWTVYLVCGDTQYPLRSVTRDISRDGFYCVIDQPLRQGERIECDIVVPTHRSPNSNDVVYLRCRARAVRAEKIGADYGIACRIEQYHVTRGAAPHPCGDRGIPKI